MGAAFDAELRKLDDAADAAFGWPALYRAPNAAPISCAVEKLAPRPELSALGGKLKMTADATVLMVQVRYFTKPPAKDDLFDLLDDAGAVRETWRVLGAPTVSDDDGRRYSIKVAAQ